jgi:hypothetical protein
MMLNDDLRWKMVTLAVRQPDPSNTALNGAARRLIIVWLNWVYAFDCQADEALRCERSGKRLDAFDMDVISLGEQAWVSDLVMSSTMARLLDGRIRDIVRAIKEQGLDTLTDQQLLLLCRSPSLQRDVKNALYPYRPNAPLVH